MADLAQALARRVSISKRAEASGKKAAKSVKYQNKKSSSSHKKPGSNHSKRKPQHASKSSSNATVKKSRKSFNKPSKSQSNGARKSSASQRSSKSPKGAHRRGNVSKANGKAKSMRPPAGAAEQAKLVCAHCHKSLPANAFTKRQRAQDAKRRCRGCTQFDKLSKASQTAIRQNIADDKERKSLGLPPIKREPAPASDDDDAEESSDGDADYTPPMHVSLKRKRNAGQSDSQRAAKKSRKPASVPKNNPRHGLDTFLVSRENADEQFDWADLAGTQWELGSDLASDYEEDREMDDMMDKRYDGVGLSEDSDNEVGVESDSDSGSTPSDSGRSKERTVAGASGASDDSISEEEDDSPSLPPPTSKTQKRLPLWLLQLQEAGLVSSTPKQAASTPSPTDPQAPVLVDSLSKISSSPSTNNATSSGAVDTSVKKKRASSKKKKKKKERNASRSATAKSTSGADASSSFAAKLSNGVAQNSKVGAGKSPKTVKSSGGKKTSSKKKKSKSKK